MLDIERSATLTISNGGTVTSGEALVAAIWGSPPGFAGITVTGPGSLWHVDDLSIGGSGGGDLLISEGGRVEGDFLHVQSGTSEPSSVTVAGPDSVLQMTSYILASGSRMDITDGGRVTNDEATMFGRDGPSAVHVTVLGSTWTTTSYMGIETNANLTVSGGGLVSCGASGVQVAGGTSSITVTGTGSRWENQTELRIGHAGSGEVSLLISDGGQVTSGNAIVASERGAALVTVTGTNSRWANAGTLTLGDRTDTWPPPIWGPAGYGTIRVSDGGMIETGSMIVWDESVLTGNGAFKATGITNHGIIRPGNSIGTLTIDGNLTMDSNSVLETEIDNSGRSDKVSVTGDVSILGGAVKPVATETITQPREYLILTANSVSGKFEALDIASMTSPALLPVTRLRYESDSVLLTVAPTRFDAGVGQTPNQRDLGAALQRIAEAGGTAITELLQQVPTLDGVRAAYDQLCGQSRPPLAPIAATDSAKFMGIVSSRLRGARGIAADGLDILSDSPLLAMALPGDGMGSGIASDGLAGSVANPSVERHFDDEDWGIWARMYGLYGDRETENGIPGYSYDVFGQSFGIDVQFSERVIGGITGGHSDGQTDHDRLSDRTDIGTTHAGLYGSYSADGWYLSGVALYSWLDLDTRRVVSLTGERPEGSFDGHEWSGYLEAGLDWQPAERWLVQPLAALQVAYLHFDEYAETGGAGALVYKAQDYESYKGSLGVKMTKELLLGSQGRAALVQGRARWVHEFGDSTSSVDARFNNVPSVWFTVSDEGVSRDSIVLGAGVGVRLSRGFRVFVDYDASLNPDTAAQVISGAAEYRW